MHFRSHGILTDEQGGQFSLNSDATRTQYGALCWRVHRGAVQVLLVSSRDTGRWIIPKGWPMKGLAPQDAALREAWEEAGVQGTADPMCLGLYTYLKVLSPDRAVPCVVSVYGVQVSRLRVRFPERKERRRKWFPLQNAAGKVEEQALRALLAAFVPPLPEPVGPLNSPAEPLSATDPNKPVPR
jgi:8-oxo-dGTP pyrophosphatase MutT (NUDIX family)